MRIKCLHGYFIFTETKVGQVSNFMARYDLDLVPKDDYFTFSALEDAPSYSLIGLPYLGVPAIANYEGRPWEVMRANGFVYSFALGLVVPIESVSQLVGVRAAGNRFVSPGLILPGSVTDDGSRVTDYAAWFSRDTLRFNYSEVEFE